MPRVIILGSHSKFLTTVLSLSLQGCSPVQRISAEGEVQSLTEVSDLRVGIQGCLSSFRADQGSIFPDVQSRTQLLVSAYMLSSGCHEVLGLCVVVTGSDVNGFWLPGVASDGVVMLTELF